MPHEPQHGLLELPLAHLTMAHGNPAIGDELLDFGGPRPDGLTRLCTKYTCPPRPISCSMAVRITPCSKGATTVWMARRSLGGVSITDISRSPSSDMCSVRGIGVAVMVR